MAKDKVMLTIIMIIPKPKNPVYSGQQTHYRNCYVDACKVYDTEPCARTAQEDIELHLRYGYVISYPRFFVMGRPVNFAATYEEITSPWVVHEAPNGWFIYLFSGDMATALTHFPYPLEFAGWERNNKLRFYPLEKVVKYAKSFL